MGCQLVSRVYPSVQARGQAPSRCSHSTRETPVRARPGLCGMHSKRRPFGFFVTRVSLICPPQILTHEVGHWVGLFHTFQEGCKDCDRYPSRGKPSEGLSNGTRYMPQWPQGPTFFILLSSFHLFFTIDNFMDYTENSCMTRFTPGQALGMRSQIATYLSQPYVHTLGHPDIEIQTAEEEISIR